jgi:hypothetical protein
MDHLQTGLPGTGIDIATGPQDPVTALRSRGIIFRERPRWWVATRSGSLLSGLAGSTQFFSSANACKLLWNCFGIEYSGNARGGLSKLGGIELTHGKAACDVQIAGDRLRPAD